MFFESEAWQKETKMNFFHFFYKNICIYGKKVVILQSEIDFFTIMELDNTQIERQDFVDNSTYEFINSLIPNEKQLDWDMESIAAVRDVVGAILGDKHICTEQEFYPFIEE